MLADKNAVATIAVKDMAVATAFYEATLGLQQAESDPGGTYFKSGSSLIFVYESQYAGTNQATALSWGVGDEFEEIIEALAAKGVTFEHYDLPGTTREGDVHVLGDGDLKAVWFKDPDGNILNLANQEA